MGLVLWICYNFLSQFLSYSPLYLSKISTVMSAFVGFPVHSQQELKISFMSLWPPNCYHLHSHKTYACLSLLGVNKHLSSSSAARFRPCDLTSRLVRLTLPSLQWSASLLLEGGNYVSSEEFNKLAFIKYLLCSSFGVLLLCLLD